MKRNFIASVITSSAPVAAGVELSMPDLTEKLVAVVLADISLRDARAYVREHCPSLTDAQKVELDRVVVTTVAGHHGITLVQASKNAVFSGLTFDKKAYPRPYNAIEYFRLTLRGLGTAKIAANTGKKAASKSTPKDDAASIAKSRPDAGYLMSLAQALMVEANKLVAASAAKSAK